MTAVTGLAEQAPRPSLISGHDRRSMERIKINKKQNDKSCYNSIVFESKGCGKWEQKKF
jgi:hypothetical protein